MLSAGPVLDTQMSREQIEALLHSMSQPRAEVVISADEIHKDSNDESDKPTARNIRI
jgi:hypothetical protein